MASLNKAIVIGHLGGDPDVRYLPSGEAVVNFTVATSETWKDKNSGEKKEQTEWHRFNAFGKLAEICAEYLKKGALVYCEGRITTKKYQDKDGVDKYATSIKLDTMKMLGPRPDGEQKEKPAPAAKQAPSGFQDLEDDIPF